MYALLPVCILVAAAGCGNSDAPAPPPVSKPVSPQQKDDARETREAASRALRSLVETNEFPAGLLDPRVPVTVVAIDASCDPHGGSDCTTTRTLGPADLEQTFGEALQVPVEVDACRNRCCNTRTTKATRVDGLSMTVLQICFGDQSRITSVAVRED